MKRLGIIVTVAALLTLVGATPALAAAPSNDLIGGAVAATVGDSFTLDTTQATTDATDAQANASCGAPATDASVWYTFAGSGAGVIVDVSKSSYSAGVLVAVGSPGSLETVACGPDTIGFYGESGTTYYVLVFDDQYDGGGNGGTLELAFVAAPPPPTIDFTVNPRGTVNARTGVATLSGTYTCTDADAIEIFGDVSQPVGRFVIRGFMDLIEFGTCDGATHTWAAEVYPDNGKFAGGKALTIDTAYACGVFECAFGFTEQKVQLSGRR